MNNKLKEIYGNGNSLKVSAKLIGNFVNPLWELEELPTIELSGIMYGNDECFENGYFYQLLVVDDKKIYKCFYIIPNDCDDLCAINYNRPFIIKDCTSQYDY